MKARVIEPLDLELPSGGKREFLDARRCEFQPPRLACLHGLAAGFLGAGGDGLGGAVSRGVRKGIKEVGDGSRDKDGHQRERDDDL
jgi:hypothetical protein